MAIKIDDVKKIKKCSAVLNIIDISTFFQIRICSDNKFFILSNNAMIKNHFIANSDVGNFFSKLAENSTPGRLMVSLWQNPETDDLLKKIYRLGIWNGISLILRYNNHTDIFSFASGIKNSRINNFYLNNITLLKRFIIYFRFKEKKLIKWIYNNQTLKLKNKISFYTTYKRKEKQKAIQELRRSILPKNLALPNWRDKKMILTKRESQYLILLFEGKSMNIIAKELGVSPRTVESCLNRVKLKAGFNTKIELLSAFLKSQTHIEYDRYN